MSSSDYVVEQRLVLHKQKAAEDGNSSLTKEYIRDLLDKNPEVRERFSYIKKTIKEIVKKTLNREFKPRKNDDKKISKTKNGKKQNEPKETGRYTFINKTQKQVINDNVLTFAKEYIRKLAEKFDYVANEKTEEQVTIALLSGVIDEKKAIKNLNNSEHKFILLCVKNDKLSEKYEERIIEYFSTQKDNNKRREIIIHAPRNLTEKMIHHINGDKKELAKDLIKYHQVDFNTKVTLQNKVLNGETV